MERWQHEDHLIQRSLTHAHAHTHEQRRLGQGDFRG